MCLFIVRKRIECDCYSYIFKTSVPNQLFTIGCPQLQNYRQKLNSKMNREMC